MYYAIRALFKRILCDDITLCLYVKLNSKFNNSKIVCEHEHMTKFI